MDKILIVDDEKSVRYAFSRTFDGEFEILTAADGQEGLEMVELASPVVVLMDIRMPKLDGLSALRRLKENHPQLPVIMVTAFADSNSAMEAMKEGAFDYVAKPFNNDELRETIRKALTVTRLQAELVCSCKKDGDHSPKPEVEQIIGSSRRTLEMCKLIGQYAPADMPVLILGETGVGKELAARAIYHLSARAGAPFLAVNCASLPEELVESELFGYEAGAFSGAVKQRIGRFEQCDRGTLFLDEIGELSLSAQAKVLRILEDGSFERLGSNAPKYTDVRLIAATNRNLDEMASIGSFRADLLHRIRVLTLTVPPLRLRLEDIDELVSYFLERFGRQVSPPIRGIAAEALEKLRQYHWPGNIRELKNTIRRAMVLTRTGIIGPEHCLFGGSVTSGGEFTQVVEAQIDRLLENGTSHPYHQLITEVEKTLIAKAIQLSGNNQVQAAQLLGINRTTLRKKLGEFGLS